MKKNYSYKNRIKINSLFFSLILALCTVFFSLKAYSFCGFYVAKADTKLYNKSSQVIIVRNENKTVISMMNDYEGDLKDFALIVPVPSLLKKEQINVAKKELFSRIDSFTAPRLVEYYDTHPCYATYRFFSALDSRDSQATSSKRQGEKSLGVKIEAKYTVGEYDIVILSAKESQGLETWLIQNGYKIPKGAHEALKPYILQGKKFFIAKVNIEEQRKTELSYLRPLQFAFESKQFMLPIRLGMINAKSPQELFIYILTKEGRVETTNYRTVKIPTDKNIPLYIKSEFSQFYKALFKHQVKKEEMKAVFLEYFWDMRWCDPCADNPLTKDELKKLGVFWLKNEITNSNQNMSMSIRRARMPAEPVKVTRLHLRYTKNTFPEDLIFQETKDNKNFQGRYILTHPFERMGDKGFSQKFSKPSNWVCDIKETKRKEKDYFENVLPERKEREAQNLAALTGWDIHKIRDKMSIKRNENSKKWYEDIW